MGFLDEWIGGELPNYSTSQICSGRGGGAGFQSNALSTTSRIRSNHQSARRTRRCRRRVEAQFRFPAKPNSICLLIIIEFIF